MRLEGNNRKNTLVKMVMTLRQRSNGKNLSIIKIIMQYITLWNMSQMTQKWLYTNTIQIHVRYKQSWLLRYNINPWGRIKFGHSYQTYNVDLRHTDTYMSIATYIQLWIHAMDHTNTLSQPGGKKWMLNRHPGSSFRLPQSTILSMWINVLKSNMVETTLLPAMIKTINKCKGDHH